MGTNNVAEPNDIEAFYSKGGAAALWDDKVAWQLRRQSEGDFYPALLSKYGCKKIIDIAAAAGFHAIELNNAGFEVTASDGLKEFVEITNRNISRLRVKFPVIQTSWANLGINLEHLKPFDAALCLGSSLHHCELPEIPDVFIQVRGILRSRGIFLVDQRNYEKLLIEKSSVTNHPGGWKYYMSYPDRNSIIFHLEDKDREISTSCRSTVIPGKDLIDCASGGGFRLIETCYDYGKSSNSSEASWVQYVFTKVE
jgi:SAM-dependent methyltransferase